LRNVGGSHKRGASPDAQESQLRQRSGGLAPCVRRSLDHPHLRERSANPKEVFEERRKMLEKYSHNGGGQVEDATHQGNWNAASSGE